MPLPLKRRPTVAVAALLAFLAFEIAWLVWVHGHDKLIDYDAYDVASAALAHGMSPYRLTASDIEALALQRGIGTQHVVPPYLYSPFLAVLLLPLQSMPAALAAVFWSAGSLLALTVSGCLLSQLRSRRWLDPLVFAGLTLFVPVMTTFYAGQVNHYLLLSMALAAWAIEKGQDRCVGAALATGILLKTIPIGLAGVLLLQRRWRALCWLAACLLGLAALTLPWAGWSLYREYLGQASQLAGAGTAPMVPANQSLGAAAYRVFGARAGVAVGAWGSAVVAVCTLALLVLTARRPRAVLPAVGLVITGVALAAPLSWIHHQVLLTIPMVILLRLCSHTPWQRSAQGVVVVCIGLLDLVALAWRPLAPWPLLQSGGTLAMALLWLAMLTLTWRSVSTATTSAGA